MFFTLDLLSFLLGFIISSIFWWLLGRSWPILAEIWESIKARKEAAQLRRMSSVEENHRRITLRRAQGMHLAAQIFAMDEVLQEPRLMAPPPIIIPGAPPVEEDISTQTVPYLPAWPELAAIYNAPTLSVPEALAGGSNIVIIGHPGMGKTVALAYLASLAANRSEKLGDLKDHIPFLIHASDLDLPLKDAQEPFDPIIEFSEPSAGVLDLGRLADFIRQAFRRGHTLLLVDGFDELPVEGQQVISNYLKVILESHPKTRIVTTGSFENLDGLLKLGFAPLALSSWSKDAVQAFTVRWGEQWAQFVSMEARAQADSRSVEPILLNEWLSTGSQGLTPLELTLKVWAAYAGDSKGPRVLDSISAHIHRLAPVNIPPAAMDTLALQVTVGGQPFFDPRKAGDWVRKYEPVDEISPKVGVDNGPIEWTKEKGEFAAKKKGEKDQKSVSTPVPSFGLLSRMINSGLLVASVTGRMRFVHPVFEGYLAGRAMGDQSLRESILNQPDWIGKTMALRYLAVNGDMQRIVDRMLEWSHLPLHRPLLNIARWLRDAPKEAPWRARVMAALAQLLQAEQLPLSLRGQVIAAFILSDDPGVPALFRQFMNTLSFELVQLCALGSGCLQDTRAIKPLESLLSAPSLAARRSACLALAAIGTNDSLEIIAHALLTGDEQVRRAAAESLANHPAEGHAMLREGAMLQDILVRRAVVYGLARVYEPWALELLEKLRVDDPQWVVRNAASEAIEHMSRSRRRVPGPLPAPSKTPWLIEFAGRQGVGIRPGSSATGILLDALKSDEIEMQLGSLQYLKQEPGEEIIAQFYHRMYSDEPPVREAIYLALLEIAAAGVKLPHPSRYGIG